MTTEAGARPAGDEEIVRDCPQCDEGAARPLPHYSVGPWGIVECAGCGFVYLKIAPSYDRLVSEFAWEDRLVAERERRRARRPVREALDNRLDWLRRRLRRDRGALYRRLFAPGAVLDVGCGGGAVPEPFTPFGIEISRKLAERSQALMAPRGGRAVHAPAIVGLRQFPDRFFTGVILRSFLEHELQPRPVLKEVARVLGPEGTAFLRVPNYGSLNRRIFGASWCGFRLPDHVNYFTTESLRRMAGEAGLAVRLLHPIRLPLDDNINAVLRPVEGAGLKLAQLHI